jgi:PST family polysaccharide transporter
MAGLPFGVSGVAVAYVLSIFVLCGPGLWYAGLPIHLSISAVVGAIWKYIASSIAAGLISWHLLYNYSPTAGLFSGLDIISRIALSTTLCTLVYLVLIVLIHGGFGPITQFISLARQMVPGLSRPEEVPGTEEMPGQEETDQ